MRMRCSATSVRGTWPKVRAIDVGRASIAVPLNRHVHHDSDVRSGILLKCFRFRVTTCSPYPRAVAPIHTSSMPIGSPRASSVARRSPARMASASPRGSTLTRLRISSRIRFQRRAPWATRAAPSRSSATQTTEVTKSRGATSFNRCKTPPFGSLRITSERTLVSRRYFTACHSHAVCATSEDGVERARRQSAPSQPGKDHRRTAIPAPHRVPGQQVAHPEERVWPSDGLAS